MDFVRANFDKILLTTLFLFVVLLVLHAIHHGSDGSFLSWIERSADQLIAALLTLIVGNRLTARKGESGSDTGPASKP